VTTPVQLWGEIRQLGYVLAGDDLEPAIADWVRTRGVGPWLVVERPTVVEFSHRGVPGTLEFSFALAQAGAMQIELIVQHNDQASTYREFLAATAGVGGLHHLAWWPADIEAAAAQARDELGYERWSGGRIGADGIFTYFATQDHPGTVVEHANITPARREAFAEMAQRSRRFEPARDPWILTRP
jgi:hypothetical protein